MINMNVIYSECLKIDFFSRESIFPLRRKTKKMNVCVFKKTCMHRNFITDEGK